MKEILALFNPDGPGQWHNEVLKVKGAVWQMLIIQIAKVDDDRSTERATRRKKRRLTTRPENAKKSTKG